MTDIYIVEMGFFATITLTFVELSRYKTRQLKTINTSCTWMYAVYAVQLVSCLYIILSACMSCWYPWHSNVYDPLGRFNR